MRDLFESARVILHERFGHAAFRPLQSRIVFHALARRDLLAVLPTGGGKSICYQLPALVEGRLTLVISPLIALMQDQVQSLERRGIAAATLNSSCPADAQRSVIAAAAANRLSLLYLSPERAPSVAEALVAAGIAVSRLAVDEAHCIVEWGHDFRPAFRALRGVRSALGGPPCLALTGSATPDVRNEIARALGFRADARTIVGSFDRPNLRFLVERVSGRDERLTRLVQLVRRCAGAAIVYAPTRGLVEGLTRVLREAGVVADPYHAGMLPQERAAVLRRFLAGQCRVVVATCAFGMGIDKPDVRLVAHWTMPSTPESYYQEAGRAGRDGAPSNCLLLHHPTDAAVPRRQLAATFPPERLIEQLWRDPSRRSQHAASILAAADRLEAELRPDRGRVNWDAVRLRRRAAARRIDAMLAYAAPGGGCRRRRLLGWFGESLETCSGCDRCTRVAR